MKTIRTDSKLVWLAYPSNQIPGQTTLCSFFWRVVAGTLLTMINGMVSVVVGLTALLGFGYKLSFDHDGSIIFPAFYRKGTYVRHWPTVGGYHVWPVTVLGGSLLIYALILIGKEFVAIGKWVYGLAVSSEMNTPLLATLIGVATAILLYRLWHSSFGVLTREYLSALKNRVCPIIEFERVTEPAGD